MHLLPTPSFRHCGRTMFQDLLVNIFLDLTNMAISISRNELWPGWTQVSMVASKFCLASPSEPLINL